MDKMDFVTEDVCKSLESNNKGVRISALKKIQRFCESPQNNTDEIILVYEKCYLHILKCYSDKFESCREWSLLVVEEFMKKLPSNDYYMHYVVSTIAKRIGQEELVEESEELRLLMVSQLTQLINKFGDPTSTKDPLLKSYNDIVDVLKKRLLDPYPAVQKEACTCIKALAAKSPSFHYRAEGLSRPLFSVIHHKHFLNRVVGIETLGIVALHITTNGECISRIITEVSPMLMDPVPAVRRECGRFGCSLMLELKDRYSFFEKLIPLVLCCLSDESEEVKEEIEKLWLKCGQQYFEENEAELNKLEIVDNVPENYPKYVQRPSIGCRALVQRCLRVVKLIMRETSDWKQDVRLHSLKLLWQFALHTEITLTPKFMEIISELARACRDPEPDIAKKALEVGNLLGCLLSYEDWFPHAFEMLENHPNLGYLKCFYAIYSTSKICNSKDINSLAALLSTTPFTHSLNEDFQIHLVKLAMVLYSKSNGDNSLEAQIEDISLSDHNTVEENLYIVAVKVMSLCNENTNPDVLKWSEDLLAQLAKGREIDYLHQNYLASVLRSLDLDFEIDDSCELIEILDGVIRGCGFRHSAMGEYKRCMKCVWTNGTNEAKIKIMSAISLAMLSWDKTLGLSDEQNLDLLQTFFNDVVVEHLEWKAGCTAESLRSLATATLCAMSEGASEGHVILLENLKYFPSLIQDNAVSTRVYALRALYRSAALKFEDYKQMMNAVLQRLDDPSCEVRKWAAIVLGKLQLNDSQNEHQEDVKKLLEDTLSVLQLHFDSPEPQLKQAIEDSVRAIGQQFPDLNETFPVQE